VNIANLLDCALDELLDEAWLSWTPGEDAAARPHTIVGTPPAELAPIKTSWRRKKRMRETG
jgi:hypothetical protein